MVISSPYHCNIIISQHVIQLVSEMCSRHEKEIRRRKKRCTSGTNCREAWMNWLKCIRIQIQIEVKIQIEIQIKSALPGQIAERARMNCLKCHSPAGKMKKQRKNNAEMQSDEQKSVPSYLIYKGAKEHFFRRHFSPKPLLKLNT